MYLLRLNEGSVQTTFKQLTHSDAYKGTRQVPFTRFEARISFYICFWDSVVSSLFLSSRAPFLLSVIRWRLSGCYNFPASNEAWPSNITETRNVQTRLAWNQMRKHEPYDSTKYVFTTPHALYSALWEVKLDRGQIELCVMNDFAQRFCRAFTLPYKRQLSTSGAQGFKSPLS